MMRKTMYLTALFSVLAALILMVVYWRWCWSWVLSLAITSVTVCYHFSMRLVVGELVSRMIKQPLNPQNRWFAQKRWETPLYQFLRVRCWKERMPTYDPKQFSMDNSLSEVVQATCISELVHELILPLSFVPVCWSKYWGAFGVFLLTSLAAALVDSSFIILQRYNRPRLLRLLNRQQFHSKKL